MAYPFGFSLLVAGGAVVRGKVPLDSETPLSKTWFLAPGSVTFWDVWSAPPLPIALQAAIIDEAD
ncbi:MAG: hypothetical protein K2Y16_04960 [Burkholderiales bacterium]|nr:hypothetical protein [Burkholderiales bacterium]